VKTRVWNKETTRFSALVIGTFPAIFFGLLLETYIETTFRSALVVAGGLIAGSVLFVLAEYSVTRIRTEKPITLWRGLGVGFFQALALIPGMSRSGSTIAGGMLLGFTRTEAARFAFLLSFPVILGAGGLKLVELITSGQAVSVGMPLAFGALVAFLSGLAAINFLISFLKRHSLIPFVIYRLVLAAIILIVFI
jgi:undecaprenyl-diphosphatase